MSEGGGEGRRRGGKIKRRGGVGRVEGRMPKTLINLTWNVKDEQEKEDVKKDSVKKD